MAKEYKEGVDFEWVSAKDSKGNVVKDGKGNPVKTRRFFKKSEKEAMKTSPRPKARPEKKPAKKDDKKATNAVRPTPGGPGKLPAAKKPAPGGARPEPGKAGGNPVRRALGAGGGRISNVPDKFRELINMNKGGMVSKKPAKTYKK